MTNIILFLCCVLTGFLAGRAMQKRSLVRADIFSDVTQYVSALKINVTGKQQEMELFNAEFLKNCSDGFRNYFADKKCGFVNRTQKQHLDGFFGNLNCSSGELLLQHLNFYEKIFEQDWNSILEEAKKSAVYVKLGLLSGAMAGILFL